MMRRVVLAGVGVVLGAQLPLSGPVAAVPDCAVTGLLTNVNLGGMSVSTACLDDPGWWNTVSQGYLPQLGADGYDYVTSGGFSWAVKSAGGLLPESVVCQQSIVMDGVQLADGQPVDLSWKRPGALDPSVAYPGRDIAFAAVPSSRAGIDAALQTPHDSRLEMALDCGAVGSARWSLPVRVLPASPPDREPGVSINAGDDFTNSPGVALSLAWQGWSHDKVKVSNDGGFAPSKTRVFDLRTADPQPWTLVDLGNERLPKTVYVKFHEVTGGWQPITYTDDIILDTVKPKVLSATLSGSATTALAGPRMVQVKAKDNKSGLASIQVSAGKPRKKAKMLKFRTAVPAPKSGRVFVRVRDGAGNWSAWSSAI